MNPLILESPPEPAAESVMKTCGKCVHFAPHTDPFTKRVHPSKAGKCEWRPAAWPMCVLRAVWGAPALLPSLTRTTIYRGTNAADCQCFKLKP